MKRHFRLGRVLGAGLALAALIAAVAGCNDNQLGAEKRRPNRPPETILSSGPPDSTYATSYKVQLFWSGSDADGTIDHYDYIMVDHPAANDSIAALDPDYARKVVVSVPEPNDPRWTATAANDTLIVSRADTLRHAPPVRPSQNDSIRAQSFERWHTFFVRAVDNEGAIDVTPQYRSFNSTTLAPDVWLLPPVDPLQAQFSGPRVIVFNWNGNDPVGDGSDLQPIAARWTILPTTVSTTGDYIGYPDTLYQLPPSKWSPWKRWDARDQSGRQAIVSGLSPIGEGPGFYLFAVQAMDEAGAVTAVFDAKTPGKNNVARIFVNDQVGAGLVVTDKFLGAYNFASASGAHPVVLDVAAGQPVSFRWRGDASYYGGSVVAYRYGWNIRNPSNDEEWQQNWCEVCTSAETRIFNSGTQEFFLQCRDNAQTITTARFELVVRQVTRTKNLLFVDDTSYPPDDRATEVREDQRWRTVIDSLLARRPFTFDPNEGGDIYDAEDNRRLPPPLSKIFDYKTVVWAARAYSSFNALKSLAYFFDPYAPRNQSTQASFNYLNIYIENGGEFWLSGDDLGYVLWPIAEAPIDPNHYQLPANITNWDDPVQPHPSIDSAGVTGFLWKLGVEVVDQGGGSKAPPNSGRANHLEHACMGFRRAIPEGYATQSFTSTVAEHHSHTLVVRTQDVVQPPAAGVMDSTDIQAEHFHTVFLSAETLERMARGESVVDSTSLSDIPKPHRHYFTLVDQVGLWGAPAVLTTDSNLWPAPPLSVNPAGGRYGVEIYNMPSWMAAATPQLNPQPGISLVLYTYVSGVPENSDTGTLYPSTADGQPSVILRRASTRSPYYSRAICGFEAWRLSPSSQLALASFILLRHFRLGLPD
jgi:hypothetical protein